METLIYSIFVFVLAVAAGGFCYLLRLTIKERGKRKFEKSPERKNERTM